MAVPNGDVPTRHFYENAQGSIKSDATSVYFGVSGTIGFPVSEVAANSHFLFDEFFQDALPTTYLRPLWPGICCFGLAPA